MSLLNRLLLVLWLSFVAQWAFAAGPIYRLGPEQMGVVINRQDPFSLEVGAYFVERYQLKPEQVLYVELPVATNSISAPALLALKAEIQAHFSPAIQGLALVWTRPYQVGCLGITYAVSLPYQAEICQRSEQPTPPSPYFNHPTVHPFRDLAIRPSMLLAANNIEQGKALVDRGVVAWSSYPKGTAYFLTTRDKARSSRAFLFPASQRISEEPEIWIQNLHEEALRYRQDVLIYQTGQTWVAGLETLKFVPGALADHLTSYGGRLTENSQMNSLKWLESGATASYGTVSEPRNYPQKFPHPQILLTHYLAGATALEAYWKSVAWPAQGVFVGNPLAAPYRSPLNRFE